MFPGVRSQSNVVAQNDWDARYAEKGSNHGRSLSRYRHFVGCECRLLGRSIDIEVTVIEDEQGRPVSHEFFCCDTFRRESIADSTLRRIVKQVARDLGQE